MKIIFLQRIWRELFGVMSIASLLKQEGHNCEVLIESRKEIILRELRYLLPDVVAFSCSIDDYEWVCEVARLIKVNMSNILIIVGGMHPTFCPEIIDENNSIDIICRGEGEYAVLELMNNLRDNKNILNIKNLWVRKNDVIYKNETRALINNLDDLPFPDRDIYYKYSLLRTNPVRFFMTSRGCPFSCSFCFNHQMKELYQNKGNYVRQRSVDNLIEEIKFVQKKYGINFIRFEDDVFILNKKWLFEFLGKYKKTVNIPFLCYIRVDILDEEIVNRLSEANCYSVLLGIETGNEQRRNSILKKRVTNEQIISASSILRKFNIRFFTSNMLALPGETLQEAFETVNLNIKIKADDVWCSVFQPWPKLEITRYALERGFITKEDLKNSRFNTFLDNNLKQKDIRQLFNLHKLFYIAVKFPYSMPIIKQLIKLPLNPVFNFLYLVCYGLSYHKHSKVNIKRIAQEGLRWFSFFLRE